MRKRIFFTTIWLFLASCPMRDTQLRRQPVHVALFISTNLEGSLTPCGCSEHMRGGLPKAAGRLAKARHLGNAVLYIDAGNGLFEASTIPEDAVPQLKRKAQAIAQALKTMGLSVRLPGPMDNALGPAFRKSLRLPETALGQVHWLSASGHSLAVVSAENVYTVNALSTQARNKGARFVIALLTQTGHLKAGDDDILANLVVRTTPQENRLIGDAVKVVQLRSKGHSLLRVDILLSSHGKVQWLAGAMPSELSALEARINLMRVQLDAPDLNAQRKALMTAKLQELTERRMAFAKVPTTQRPNTATLRFVPIEATLPEEATVRNIVATYNNDVAHLNLARAQKYGKACEKPTSKQNGYAGSAACVTCHPEATRVWRATRHAHAYESLVAKGQQFHLDCIACHVTGWQQPGGVCRIDNVTGRAEVGCESCHGPGWQHTRMPQRHAMPSGIHTCTGCHDAENSPHFDFKTYRKQIVAPGHGQRAKAP